MSRLVIAVVILFGVLAGLRFANASLFQRNVANQINSPALNTRSTGFNVEPTGAVSGTGVASQSLSTQALNQTGNTADTTALPAKQQSAVPGNW